MTGFTDSHRAHRLQQNAARNAARLEDVLCARPLRESCLFATMGAAPQAARQRSHPQGASPRLGLD